MRPLPFLGGADVSFLDEQEAQAVVFRDGAGRPRDFLSLARDLGWNVIRLRLWNAPAGGYCDMAHTLAMARRIRAAGLRLLLDFHYSDHWADPGKQTKPAAWRDLGFDDLCTAVYDYTREAVEACRPDVVQVGNEITSGMLWDDGRVGGPFDTDAQWARFARLLSAGTAGVRDAAPGAGIMIHIDRGGDNRASGWFFDHLCAHPEVPFDLIGQSFYPWWHGTLDQLSSNLADISSRYGRDVVVVETGYPRTLEDADGAGNFVSAESQLHPGFPATPEGQAAFLRALMDVVSAVPQARGKGVLYWEPAYFSRPGLRRSPCDNLTLFDDAGRPLPAAGELAPR